MYLWRIMQYTWPPLSDNWSWNLNGRFRQGLLYWKVLLNLDCSIVFLESLHGYQQCGNFVLLNIYFIVEKKSQFLAWMGSAVWIFTVYSPTLLWRTGPHTGTNSYLPYSHPHCIHKFIWCSAKMEHSGSVVECLTRNQCAVGSSLKASLLWHWARHIYPC